MLFTCKNLMFSDFAWKKIFCSTKCWGGGQFHSFFGIIVTFLLYYCDLIYFLIQSFHRFLLVHLLKQGQFMLFKYTLHLLLHFIFFWFLCFQLWPQLTAFWLKFSIKTCFSLSYFSSFQFCHEFKHLNLFKLRV